MKKFIYSIIKKYICSKNGETRCANCGTPCQGFKAPDGKILCYDCYKKLW